MDGDSLANLSTCHCSNPLCHLPVLLCRWGKHSPHVHFSPICLAKTIAWGIAAIWVCTSVFVGVAVGGIGQSALASNKFVEADSLLGHEMSSLTWKVGALGISSCCGGLDLGMEGFFSAWGLSVG